VTARQASAAAGQRYRTIVVDPPWNYHDKLGDGPRGAASHYDCASFDDIAAIPVGTWAERDAHLYLWVTNAFMEEGHELARLWGFEKRTILTWVKPYIGMGHWFRNSTEHVLFCVRGRLGPQRRDLPTHFNGRNAGRKHSQKPDAFYDLVEAMSPGPYIDVFSRTHRMGWAVFGNEVYSDIPLVGTP
jgi:N6-adenosine-specific RNA methylase IME4